MEQRVTMIMVGAKDIATIRSFCEKGMGWQPCHVGGSGSIMYKVGFAVLVFLKAGYLAAERGEPIAAGTKGSLATFLDSREAVDQAIQTAVGAGGTITSPARDRDGGLYSAYFTDPEENSWEVVHATRMSFSETGELMFG